MARGMYRVPGFTERTCPRGGRQDPIPECFTYHNGRPVLDHSGVLVGSTTDEGRAGVRDAGPTLSRRWSIGSRPTCPRRRLWMWPGASVPLWCLCRGVSGGLDPGFAGPGAGVTGSLPGRDPCVNASPGLTPRVVTTQVQRPRAVHHRLRHVLEIRKIQPLNSQIISWSRNKE